MTGASGRTGNVIAHKSSTAGVTLIELVIIIFIIGIIIGLAAPNFRTGYSNLALNNALRHISQMIRYAQERAIVERRTFRLNIDTANRKFWITRQSQEKAGVFDVIKGSTTRPYRLPERFSLEADKEKSAFFPDGESEQVSIKITDPRGITRTLETSHGIGRTRIKK